MAIMGELTVCPVCQRMYRPIDWRQDYCTPKCFVRAYPAGEEIMPWHDCPACPKCASFVGTPTHTRDSGRWYGPADATLFCPACGHGWHGSGEEIHKAERAWQAWVKRRREMAAP